VMDELIGLMKIGIVVPADDISKKITKSASRTILQYESVGLRMTT
jgi:ABC-type Fe3+-citrate transport system substrate-binding protein